MFSVQPFSNLTNAPQAVYEAIKIITSLIVQLSVCLCVCLGHPHTPTAILTSPQQELVSPHSAGLHAAHMMHHHSSRGEEDKTKPTMQAGGSWI